MQNKYTRFNLRTNRSIEAANTTRQMIGLGRRGDLFGAKPCGFLHRSRPDRFTFPETVLVSVRNG
jgi:hypothetical protein